MMVSQTVGRSRVALEICVESAVGAAAAIAGDVTGSSCAVRWRSVG
ncbi:hypothetical protein [Sphingomonas melonis]|nr:hypothetical protein [Sphingomonas melonis]